MTCNASDLVNAAKCYCFPKGMAGAIQTYLLCKWAQIEIENPPPPCEFAIALDGPGRVILSWGNPVVYDLIEVWHAPLFGPRHLETTLPGTDTSWTTPILAPGDYFIIRGKIGDDYSGFATGDTCPPPTAIIEWLPTTQTVDWIDGGGPNNGDYPTFLANVDMATLTSLNFGNFPFSLTSLTNLQSAPSLTGIFVDSNSGLSSLDASDLPNLQLLSTSGSGVTSVDLSNDPMLSQVTCSYCQLGTLNITGDFAITSLDFSNNPAVVIIGP